jgi:alpha-1,3-rhamnosyl/mannosyltransferase
MRVIVNAVPLLNIHTGISRYLRCLYTEMERLYADEMEIGYFDGEGIVESMPSGPANLARWSRWVSIFWRMPAPIALTARLAMHYKREYNFSRVAKDYELYHEAGFFPLNTPEDMSTVFTIHDLSLQRFPELHPRERVLYTRLFFPSRIAKVKQFITVSDFSKTEMDNLLKISPEKTTVTPLAHDSELFHPRPAEEVDAFREKYGLPEKYFLFVGSRDPRKNLDVIPRALKKAGLDIPIAAIGWSGWSKDMKMGHPISLGYVDNEDLARSYSGALALLLPSRYEGFGLPIIEAMACGCPVVTTKEASLPEVAGDCAVYMSDPDDANNLAHILRRLLEDEAFGKDLSERGIRHAENFSWSKTAAATFHAFQKAVGGR